MAVTAAVVAGFLTLAGCGSGGGSGKSFHIGVTQIVQHPSLDLIVDGFRDVLKEAGIEATYDETNAQGDVNNAATIAGRYAEDSSIDLVLAIATPSAQAAVQAITDRPVLFAGITDPVAAGLVAGTGPSGTNVTGTSDLNPTANPVTLISELVPGTKTVGVLYSSAEMNSEVQVAAFKAEAEPLGITINDRAISNSSEVVTGMEALAGVDAILIPTDNTVVSALDAVIDYCNQHRVPLFTADAESVVRGSIATRGISYYELGRRTGEMALKILVDGEKPGDIPFLVVTDTELKYNSKAALAQGVEFPPEILEGAVDVAE